MLWSFSKIPRRQYQKSHIFVASPPHNTSTEYSNPPQPSPPTTGANKTNTYNLTPLSQASIFMPKNLSASSIRTTIFISAALFLSTAAHATMALDSDEEEAPFYVVENLFNQQNINTLDLEFVDGAETFTVFSPDDNTDKYSNGAVMAAFKGTLYCMWQSSGRDEDSADTWVAYSRSEDGGQTWCKPKCLAPALENGYCTSGGWIVGEDEIVGFINIWQDDISSRGGYTMYVKSSDGLNWSQPADVTMKDGSRLDAIFEQDPHRLKNGRIINAAHFHPDLYVCPIYTDDPSGITGWVKSDFMHRGFGDQSRELEPSLFQKADGSVVMIFRDQNSTFQKLAAASYDNGETWTNSMLTNMPDARTKQSAGNLPDGTAFLVGNPVYNKTRFPLAITLSKDGNCFDTAYLIREGGDTMPALRYPGSAKRAGYHYPKSMVDGDYLYVAYTLNKEDVQFTRLPLRSLFLLSEVPRTPLEIAISEDEETS